MNETGSEERRAAMNVEHFEPDDARLEVCCDVPSRGDVIVDHDPEVAH